MRKMVKRGTNRLRLIAAVAIVSIMITVSPSSMGFLEPNDYDKDVQWALHTSNYVFAWDPTTQFKFTNPGSNQIVVAVIDNGCDLDELDLAANLWQNPKDPIDGVDNDGNGHIDDHYGCDFWDDDGDGSINEDPVGNGNKDKDFWVDTDDNDQFDYYLADKSDYHTDIIFLDADDDGQFDADDTVLRAVGVTNIQQYYGSPTLNHDLTDEDGSIPDIDIPTSPDDLGTRAAAVVAEIANNNLQQAGGAQVSVMVLKTHHLDRNFYDYPNFFDRAEAAIQYAIDWGADIISISPGFPTSKMDELYDNGEGVISSPTPLADILEEAYDDEGILIFAGAGEVENEGVFYPATDEHVIAVGGTKKFANQWQNVAEWLPNAPFSQGDEIEVVAGGVDIKMIGALDTGTWYSSALATAASALVLSYRPSLSNVEVRALLHSTGTPLVKSDNDWASSLDPNTDEVLTRGYGEVNAFNALRIANYMHDWWNEEQVVDASEDPARALGFKRDTRPDVAIDRHGNSHVVWFSQTSVLPLKYEVVYNMYSARGEKLMVQDLYLEAYDVGGGQQLSDFLSTYVDIEVDSFDTAHIAWAKTTYGNGKIYYAQVKRGEVVLEPTAAYTAPGYGIKEPTFTNLMLSEHPAGKGYLVFNLLRHIELPYPFEGYDRREIHYIEIDNNGQKTYPPNDPSKRLQPKNQENSYDLNAVSADIGRVGGTDRIFYVWEEVQYGAHPTTDDPDVWWNAYDTSTHQRIKNGNPAGLLLRDKIDLGGGNFRWDDEHHPSIDVDRRTGYNYIVWKRKVMITPPPEPYDVLEYVWIDPNGVDLTGWNNGDEESGFGDPTTFQYVHRVSQIGESSDNGRPTYGEVEDPWDPVNLGYRQKMYPVISYNSNSAKWDKLPDPQKVSYSTIAWSEFTDEGWGIYYTHVMPNGREILPDDAPMDKELRGQAILHEDALPWMTGAPAITSGLETENSNYDGTGNIRIVWGKSNVNTGVIYMKSTAEQWNLNYNLGDGNNPDIAVDSSDNYHVVKQLKSLLNPVADEIFYMKYDSVDTHIYSDWISVADMTDSIKPKIIRTKDGSNEYINIFWIETAGFHEIHYVKLDADDPTVTPLVGPARIGFMPQNRPNHIGFSIDSYEIGYDEERQKIHVIYSVLESFSELPVQSALFHGSIDLNNGQYHSESQLATDLDDPFTASIEVGPDSTPFGVYGISGDIYAVKLNEDPVGARIVSGPDQIDDLWITDRESSHPNLMIDRDLYRRDGNVVDWDDDEDNDRFIHVAFYTEEDILGNPTEVHYVKIDKDLNFIVNQRPIIDLDSVQGALDYQDIDIIIDSDNRVSVVAMSDSPMGFWFEIPDYAWYYVKVDNNGEILTAPIMINILEIVLVAGEPSGSLTYDEYNRMAMDINGDGEAHIVFERTFGDPPATNIYHTRFNLD